MIVPNISWRENEVLITYNGTKLCYNYSSLPDRDLNIAGVDLDEFNAMLESIRYDPKKKFVRSFKIRSDDPPGFQRCRALSIARIYPNEFNIVSMSFCTLAYRYIHDNMGSIKEIENLYKQLQGFKEFDDPYRYSPSGNYRWTTSIWTALAHCYVKEGNGNAALNIFNKIHSFADITLWPPAILNVIGACYVTGQSIEYSKKIYEAAIHVYDIKNIYVVDLYEIIHTSKILEVIMGNEDRKAELDHSPAHRLYLEANDLLKKRI